MASNRVVIDMSVQSYELVKAALSVHLSEIAIAAAGAQSVGDQGEFSDLQSHYFHGKNLLAKLAERRSIVEEY